MEKNILQIGKTLESKSIKEINGFAKNVDVSAKIKRGMMESEQFSVTT